MYGFKKQQMNDSNIQKKIKEINISLAKADITFLIITAVMDFFIIMLILPHTLVALYIWVIQFIIAIIHSDIATDLCIQKTRLKQKLKKEESLK